MYNGLAQMTHGSQAQAMVDPQDSTSVGNMTLPQQYQMAATMRQGIPEGTSQEASQSQMNNQNKFYVKK